MHKLLARQLQRHLGTAHPPEQLESLLAAIAETYAEYDQERYLLDHCIQQVSGELSAINHELHTKLEQLSAAHAELARYSSLLDCVFDATGEAILAFDTEARLLTCNNAGQLLLNLNDDDLAHARSTTEVWHKLQTLLASSPDYGTAERSPTTHEVRVGAVELADQRLLEFHCAPQKRGDEISGQVFCFRDVTRQRSAEALIAHQAYHDNLTNLPNRARLEERLQIAINHARATGSEGVALLFIDLDHFKRVNDTVGHQVGDILLVEVGARIRRCLRSEDMLARFGGDEFVVLVPNATEFLPQQISERIIEALRQPFTLSGHRFHVSCSIGISRYPQDDFSAQQLIRKADLAMYVAKDAGRGVYRLFDHALEQTVRRQLDVEMRLRNALLNNEFTVYFQPKLSLHDLRIVSVEALLRWFPPNGEQLSPAVFIPIAERAGLVADLDLWVLKQTCAQLKRWHRRGHADLTAAVNLSAQQFTKPNLVAEISAVLHQYSLDGASIELEITESMLMEDVDGAIATLKELRALGIRIAIDDFGTGYSSLRYLQRLPIDVLKIDQSFIRNLETNPGDQSIVAAIIDLAHNLGVKVVAEGVENERSVEYLARHGCDLAQGFFFFKPLPTAELTQALKQRYVALSAK